LTCSIIFSLEAKQNYRFPATGLPVEVKRTVWYRDVFGFSFREATSLYADQLFKDTSTIAELGDSKIESVCCTLHRDSGLPIAELANTQLKLLPFWVRHQNRTGREIGGTSNPLVRTELATLNQLKEQKRLEDGWAANNKEPEYAFGEDDSNDTSHNHETITHCPILTEDCNYEISYDELEI